MISEILNKNQQQTSISWTGVANARELAELILADSQDTQLKVTRSISMMSDDFARNVNTTLEEQKAVLQSKFDQATKVLEEGGNMSELKTDYPNGSISLKKTETDEGEYKYQLFILNKDGTTLQMSSPLILNHPITPEEMATKIPFSDGEISMQDISIALTYQDSIEAYHILKEYAPQIGAEFTDLKTEATFLMSDGSIVNRLVELGEDYTMAIYYGLGGDSIADIKAAGLSGKQCVASSLNSAYNKGFNMTAENLTLICSKAKNVKKSMSSIFTDLQQMYTCQDITSKVMQAVAAGKETASDMLATVSGYASKYAGSAKSMYDKLCSAAQYGSASVLAAFKNTYTAISNMVAGANDAQVQWGDYDGTTVNEDVGTAIFDFIGTGAQVVGAILLVSGVALTKIVGGLMALAGTVLSGITKALTSITDSAPSFHINKDDDIFGNQIGDYDRITIPVRYRSTIPGDGTMERFRIIGDSFVAFFYRDSTYNEPYVYSVKIFPNVHVIPNQNRLTMPSSYNKIQKLKFGSQLRKICTTKPFIGISSAYCPVTTVDQSVIDINYADTVKTTSTWLSDPNVPSHKCIYVTFTPCYNLSDNKHVAMYKSLHDVETVYRNPSLWLSENDATPENSRTIFFGSIFDGMALSPVDCSAVIHSDLKSTSPTHSITYHPDGYIKYGFHEQNTASPLSYPRIAHSVCGSIMNLINYLCYSVASRQDSHWEYQQAIGQPINRLSMYVPAMFNIATELDAPEYADPMYIYIMYALYGDLDDSSGEIGLPVGQYLSWDYFTNNFLPRIVSTYGCNDSFSNFDETLLYPDLDSDYAPINGVNKIDLLWAVLEMNYMNSLTGANSTCINMVGSLENFKIPEEGDCAILAPKQSFSTFIIGMSMVAVVAAVAVVTAVVASSKWKKRVQRNVVKKSATTGDLYNQYNDACGYGEHPERDTKDVATQNQLLKTYVKSARKLNFYMNFTGIGSYDVCSQFASGDGYSPMVTSVADAASQLYGFCESKVANDEGEIVDEPYTYMEESTYPLSDNTTLLSIQEILKKISGSELG